MSSWTSFKRIHNQTFKMAQTYVQYQLKRVQDRCTHPLKSGANSTNARISDTRIPEARTSQVCASMARASLARVSLARTSLTRTSLAWRAHLWRAHPPHILALVHLITCVQACA